MGADVIQANYEKLDTIASRFKGQAEANADLHSRIKSCFQTLKKDWVGKGVEAFSAEMNGELFPAMQRLISGLEEARTVTLEVKNIIWQAEEEAARYFTGDHSGDGLDKTAAAGGTAFADSGAKTSPGGGVVSGGQAKSSVNPSQALVARDPHSVFEKQYREGMINLQLRGAGNPQLNQAMERLLQNPSPQERERLLDQIADLRGKPREEIRAQYEKYLQISKAATRTPAAIDTTSEALDFSDNPDFLGSTTSLRYGKVVGDVFGIDPVFGALLNPTGGLMGPDNGLPIQPASDNPLAYHSVFHDAGGYLRNSHNLGPGYDYLGREPHRDPMDPFTGQKSGIHYWRDQLDEGWWQGLGSWTSEKIMDIAVWGKETF